MCCHKLRKSESTKYTCQKPFRPWVPRQLFSFYQPKHSQWWHFTTKKSFFIQSPTLNQGTKISTVTIWVMLQISLYYLIISQSSQQETIQQPRATFNVWGCKKYRPSSVQEVDNQLATGVTIQLSNCICANIIVMKICKV